MDSKNIEQLLEKYWLCETSLEEEQQLREFFKTNEIPGSLKEASALFHFFEEEKSKSLNEKFDLRVTKELTERREGKLVKMVSFTNVMRIAAGVFVLVAATYFIREEVRKSYPPELQDTYTDPQLAFEETKKALMMISSSFGKAKHEAEKMKVFNEAEKKVQQKGTAEKATI